jgi:hypothetical protein
MKGNVQRNHNIVRLILEGHAPSEVARQTGTSRERVRQIFVRVSRHAWEHMEDELAKIADKRVPKFEGTLEWIRGYPAIILRGLEKMEARNGRAQEAR